MSILQPFRAFRAARSAIYVPGEEAPRRLLAGALTADTEPALFLYRQSFCLPGDDTQSVRNGVMGLLNRAEANVFRHEETVPDRVAACASLIQSGESDPGSLWLWCGDPDNSLASRWDVTEAPEIEATDRFGCLHQIWPVTDGRRIRDLQLALDGQPLFLADGHHRFAAGWTLATVQIRSSALRSLASHRLVLQAGDTRLPATRPVEDVDRYLASAAVGHSRYVVVTPGPVFGGFEVLTEVPVLQWVPGATIEAVRGVARAIAAVQAGQARMALLVAPFSIECIEQQARRGMLLPPKSTDFYPKLAAGLVLHRRDSHPNEKGVRDRSDMHAPSAYVT